MTAVMEVRERVVTLRATRITAIQGTALQVFAVTLCKSES